MRPKKAVEIGTASLREDLAVETTRIRADVAAAREVTTDRTRIEGASHILNRESVIRERTSLVISYKTEPGLSPVIDVYDANNVRRVSEEEMVETEPGESGIYEYEVTFVWGRGTHSIICKEPARGTLEGINIRVISTDLEDMERALTVTMGQTSQLAGLDLDRLGDVSESIAASMEILSTISLVMENLARLGRTIEDLPDRTDIESISQQVRMVSETMREVSRIQGLRIEKMFEVSEEQFQSVTSIRNKVEEVKVLVELQQEILEQDSDEPVIRSWLEIGE